MRLRVVAFLLAALAASAANAADVKLPPMLALSGQAMGFQGAYVVAIGEALQKNFGTRLELRNAGAGPPVFAPLREGSVALAGANGATLLAAVEGVVSATQPTNPNFAQPTWGPQPVRTVFQCLTPGGAGNMMTAADAGIRTLGALKGKRVARNALNTDEVAAVLAFAGLTWSDVIAVDVANGQAAIAALLANQADAMVTATTGAPAAQLAASPRGLFWPPVPAADTAGWQRLRAITPQAVPGLAVEGPGISPERPLASIGTVGLNVVALATQDSDLVYNLAKAVFATYGDYRAAAPGIDGCNVAQQVLGGYVAAWHEGAIRYFKEIGVWSEALQQANDRLAQRQEILAGAWTRAKAGSYANDDAFRAAWMKTRAAALTAAGFEPFWTE